MPGAGPSVGIGAVLDALVEDHPDVTISKIRYLEAQGLITPERTPKGSRRYRPEDIERLRFVLTAQRDRFWPLKVIHAHLDALDRGLVPAEVPSGETAVVPPTGGARMPTRSCRDHPFASPPRSSGRLPGSTRRRCETS